VGQLLCFLFAILFVFSFHISMVLPTLIEGTENVDSDEC